MRRYIPRHDLLWRGVLYRAGVAVAIPDDLAIAIGVQSPEPAEPEDSPLPAEPSILEPPALHLLKTATKPEEMTPIVGIGIGVARELLANRPEEGYESIEQAEELNPKLSKAPYNVKWAQIAQWEPED